MTVINIHNVVRNNHFANTFKRGRKVLLEPTTTLSSSSMQSSLTCVGNNHRHFFSSKSPLSPSITISSIGNSSSSQDTENNNTTSPTYVKNEAINNTEEQSSSSSTGSTDSSQYTKAALELSKAKLSALVVSTTTFGYLAAAPIPFSYTTLAAASLGTGLCSSCASTLNQIYERDRDAKMKRTAHRPLVKQNVIGVNGAYSLACTTGIAGAATLYIGTDAITTALGVGNIILYSGIYTYLKPRSTWNTWIGAFVGAIPPVMGYTAATNGSGMYDIEALLLGSTLFLWQFPHFFALSWMHRVDYARGGFKMISTETTSNSSHSIGSTGGSNEEIVICPEDETSRLITNYTYYLSTLPIISTLTGVTGSMFAIEGFALNGYAIYVAKKFDQDRSNKNARTVFLTSLWYLPCWMMLFLLHSNKWRDGKTDNDDEQVDQNIVEVLKRYMNDIRNTGRELCPHEILVFDNNKRINNGESDTPPSEMDTSLKCPIVLGKSSAQQAGEQISKGNVETKN